jgi:enoyl-CoA hydratase
MSGREHLVRLTVSEGVGEIRLTDPARRNALSAAMSDQLSEAVDRALGEGVGALVLSAEPPVFCAGGSLEGLLSREVPLADLYRGLVALAEAPVPTIAAVGGPTIGAGVNLPLACDVVIVSPSAHFDPRFLDVGIHPGGGHLWRLMRRVGSQGAAAMVLCGDAVTGAEAVKAGLAWRCVDDVDLETAARTLAHRAASRPRSLVIRTKETLRVSERLANPEDAFDLELEAQQWSMDQPGFDDRIRALQADLIRKKRANDQ